MSRVDMHPEELLDAARRGELSAVERSRLSTHVDHCVACKVELAAMADFDREIAPREGDGALASRLIAGALADLGVPADAGRVSGAGASPVAGAARPMRRRVVGVAVTALTIGLLGGAAAAFWATSPFDGDAPAEIETPASQPAPADAPRRPVRITTPPEPETVEPETVTLEVDHPELESPPPASLRPRPEPVPLTAEELLAQGNEARRGGDYARAERLYRTLQRTYPSSREAAVSRVTLGRLLLDGRADADAALDQFDRYLERHASGVLAEEARVGRALALGRLGRAAEEQAAWRDLLAHHPDSLHAERARRAVQP